MITVHNLENSQSIRILWLLEELGVDYHIEQYSRTPGQGIAPSQYKKLHPIGTSPTISDDDFALPETNAIMDYILDKHPNPQLRPEPGSPQRARYLYWFHATQGSLMPMLLDSLILKRMSTLPPFPLRNLTKIVTNKVTASFVQPRLDRIFSFMEQQLSQSTWLSGEEFTAADIVMGYCLEVAEVRIGFDNHYPHIAGFINHMRQRPAYQRALAKNGPFSPIAE